MSESDLVARTRQLYEAAKWQPNNRGEVAKVLREIPALLADNEKLTAEVKQAAGPTPLADGSPDLDYWRLNYLAAVEVGNETVARAAAAEARIAQAVAALEAVEADNLRGSMRISVATYGLVSAALAASVVSETPNVSDQPQVVTPAAENVTPAVVSETGETSDDVD